MTRPMRLLPPVICAMLRPLPALSLIVKVTSGALPAAPFSILMMSTFTPGRDGTSVGTMCEFLMEASYSISPCGMWHCEHWLSLACGRLTWPAPVAKFTSSWQAPQAARVGFFIHASACAAPDFGSWQNSQRIAFEGIATVEKSCMDWLLPMIWYGL